jgi:hypothetical protein
MAAQKSISNPTRRLPAPQQARTAADGVDCRARVPDRGRSHRARAGLRELAAGLGIAVLALLNTSAPPTAGTVPAPATHFVDHGRPILHTAQIHLLYWGSHWPATGIYFPTRAGHAERRRESDEAAARPCRGVRAGGHCRPARIHCG